MHFLLNRGQFSLLFCSENSPIPLMFSTSSTRVSLSTLSILDASISTVNQLEGRQDSLLKVGIARLKDCLKMVKQRRNDGKVTAFRHFLDSQCSPAQPAGWLQKSRFGMVWKVFSLLPTPLISSAAHGWTGLAQHFQLV